MQYIDWFSGVSAVIPSLMALLGAIVSLAEDWAKKHRVVFLLGFIFLGLIGTALTIRSNRESAQVSANFATNLGSLSHATDEIKRVTALNTDLQEQLLKSNAAMVALSKENLEQTTGRKGYCVVTPLTEPNQNEFRLLIYNPTRYALYGVWIDVLSADRLPNSFFVGDIAPRIPRTVNERIHVEKNRDNHFRIQICSRASCLLEMLVVSWNNDKWNDDYELRRIGGSGLQKPIHRIANNFPYITHPSARP